MINHALLDSDFTLALSYNRFLRCYILISQEFLFYMVSNDRYSYILNLSLCHVSLQ